MQSYLFLLSHFYYFILIIIFQNYILTLVGCLYSKINTFFRITNTCICLLCIYLFYIYSFYLFNNTYIDIILFIRSSIFPNITFNHINT